MSGVLEHVQDVEVPSVEKFVAGDHFKLHDSGLNGRKVTINSLLDSFVTGLVPKIEENIPRGKLRVYVLTEPMLAAHIIAELGKNHVTYLADVWTLLEKQPRGESGVLRTDGRATIAFIPGVQDVYIARTRWSSQYHGWSFKASPLTLGHEWDAGDLVLSR